jgi:tetratricopeptide (TPR) repeat protein
MPFNYIGNAGDCSEWRAYLLLEFFMFHFAVSFAGVSSGGNLDEFSREKAVAYYNKGCLLDDQQKYEKALVEYEKALKIRPTFYQALVNKASALERLARYQEALKSINEGLRINPQNEIGWDVSARIQLAIKNYHQVINDSNRCLKIVPSLNCFLRKGNAFEKLKLYKEARQAYSRGLKFHPANSDLLSNRTLMSFKLLDLNAIESDLREFKKHFPEEYMVPKFEQAFRELRDLKTKQAQHPTH